MADKVKDFFNAEILLSEFTANKKTLFSTDATTTAVIRDVRTNGALAAMNARLTINGDNILSLDSDGNGTEIVGVNSDVGVEINPNLNTIQTMNYIKSDGSAFVFSTLKNMNGIDVSKTYTAVNGVDLDVNYANYGYWRTINGHFYSQYSNGYSSYRLYTDPTTVIESTYCAPKAFDGVDTFYAVTTANTVTKIVDLPLGGYNKTTFVTTYGTIDPDYCAQSTFCNGLIWYVPSNSYTTMVYAIDLSTHNVVYIDGLQYVQSDASYHLAVSYDSNTDQYTIIRTRATVLYTDTLPAGLVIDNSYQNQTVTSRSYVNTIPSDADAYSQHLTVDDELGVINICSDTSNTVYSWDIATGAMTTITAPFPEAPLNGNAYYTSERPATQAEMGLNNLSLRITGVETTGVI